MLNSIYEQRKRIEDKYYMSLTMPRSEYLLIYGDNINEKNASEIVGQYLDYKEDDGRANNIKIYDYKDSNIINIEADISYLGNDHTDYTRVYY
ncbi:hypothetical protein EDC19_0254 [Natranaerovirga hydrolytica]|uniref:Uncharacterized protein n=1 Tax=Natranaerovirga hydrolytica TaxID=680378 RepID=A0A4R1MZ71_9FIRM|nr:hypothetical protein [Natranaerovirga hydrolytica]TCK97852.1 hypothetical protein EDC19_0254 [Natranaerovirga hydrolytica]